MDKTSILEGADSYWKSMNGCIALDDRWEQEGETPSKKVVKDTILSIPVRERNTVMEIGCGSGHIIKLLDSFETYYAVDQSRNMLILCWLRWNRDKRVRCIISWNGVDTSADLILSIEVAQHQSDPIGYLKSLISKGNFNHFVFTLLVSGLRTEYGLESGTGSIAVSLEEADSFVLGMDVKVVTHDSGLVTYVCHYGNMSSA